MPLDEKPRVAYVVKVYPRLSETFIVTEILAHEAAGLDIEIFSLRTPADGCFHEALARVRAPVSYLACSRLRASELWTAIREASQAFPKVWSSLEHAGTHSSDEAYQAILLARALRDRSITHIHAHFGTSAASVARMASAITGIPYSITVHAKDIYHQDVDQSELRWKLREAGTTITVSDFNVTHLRRCFGDDAGRVRRIYNGLDLNEFSYEQPVDRPPTIVAVGRLIKKKGFGDLIDACAILAEHGRSFQCRIIGDGNLRDELADQIERLDLTDRVSLLGPKPRGEVITALRQASLIAAPCVVGPDGNRDGLPTVLLEGMALGTPCISTDVTGIPELVRDEDTGLITPQHDPAMLARKIECLLDDPQLRVALAERGRQLMEAEFDIHRNTEQMREIFSLNGATCAARVKEVV